MLTIVAKPWCHVPFWCPLQLHNNFCDQVVVNIVEKDNSHFLNQSQNPRCVVVIVKISQFPMDTRYLFSWTCTYLLFYATSIIVPYATFFCCCMKLWYHINYSNMKWYIAILLYYNVYHLYVLHSWHILIAYENCGSCTT
jgi:hypothetical protein